MQQTAAIQGHWLILTELEPKFCLTQAQEYAMQSVANIKSISLMAASNRLLHN